MKRLRLEKNINVKLNNKFKMREIKLNKMKLNQNKLNKI